MDDWGVMIVGTDDRVVEVLVDRSVLSAVSVVEPTALHTVSDDRRPDCVVVDLDSVASSCVALLEEITDMWAEIPIVVGGESLATTVVNGAVARGADQFLFAGLVEEPDDLSTRIETAVSRRATEEAKTESRTAPRNDDIEQYETIVEAVPEGVFVLDEEGRIVDGNQAAAELFDDTVEGLVGRAIKEFVDDGVIERVALERYVSIVRELLSSDSISETEIFEMELEPTEGDRRTCEVHVTLRPFDEAYRGTIGIIRDVTQRREQLRELKRTETIIDALPDMVWAADLDGNILYWNEKAAELHKFPSDGTIDPPLPATEIMPDEAIEEFAQATRRLQSEEQTQRTSVEYTVGTYDGSRQFPVRTHLALLYDETDELVGTAGVSRDISEQRRRKRRLQVLNRVLRHNIRNDVSKIDGYAERIQDAADDPEIVGYAEIVDDIADDLDSAAANARRLQNVIKADLPEDATVDVTELVEPVLEEMHVSYPDAEIDSTMPETCHVRGTDDLSFALSEAIENAVEHNDNDVPYVEVVVERADTAGIVRIRDDGPGVPDHERAIVYGEQDITALTHGSGLGLWVVKWIVELHDGDVEILDRTPRGSEIRFSLPSR